MAGNMPGTILIVEDDIGVANLERRCLERAGFEVFTAATREEAWQALKLTPMDLILLDYQLPGGVDGLAFYSELKQAGHDLPVILVTGFGNTATVIQSLRAGVRDFVNKSVEFLDYLPEAVTRILKQVRTEHQLAESEARLASIIESAQDAILVVDASERITLFNTAAEKMFRCHQAEALGQPLSRFMSAEWMAAAEPGLEQRIQPFIMQTSAEARGLRSDGEVFPLESSVSRASVGGRTFHTIVARDITEKKKLETQLLHSQRMESIGRLAGGIAHDFNNLLTVIYGYSELLLMRLPPNDSTADQVREIRKAGERAARLTRQLLAFSRKQILNPEVIDLNHLIHESEKMFRPLIGEDIDFISNLASSLGSVRADPGQLEQVLLNLIVNARDAMPTGGLLTLETRNVDLDESYAAQHPGVGAGSYVLLALSDSGCGMDETVKARIFEPFFTTKPQDKGTGLGLATVFGIVQQSGGHIEVYSEPGHGTSFKIYLPRLDGGKLPDVHGSDHSKVPGGTETILLAEDEEGVRSLANVALKSHGFHVLEGRDGQEAANICRSHAGVIHLLVTDVVMPKISGRVLADSLRAMRPDLKILYLSGYTDDAVFRHGILESGMPFLQKPFTPATLARKVREVLDS